MFKLLCPKLPKILAVLLIFALFFTFSQNFSQNIALAQETGDFLPRATSSASSGIQEVTSSPLSSSSFNRQYTDKVVGLITTLHIASCILVGERCWGEKAVEEGVKPSLPAEVVSFRPFYKDGLLGVTTNLIAFTYTNPPSSLSYSIGKFIAKFDPIPKTYAQNRGIGLSTLSAFSSFWSVNRNVAYTLIVFILLITGFLIIFRFKIDPHTSIDLEKTIIRTIFVLVAITFSFAIAGFLLDLMYLSIFAVSYLARQNNLVAAQTIENIFTNANPASLFNFLITTSDPGEVAKSLIELIPQQTYAWLHNILGMLLASQISPFFANAAANAAQSPIGSFIAAGIGAGAGAGAALLVTGWLVDYILKIFVSIGLLFLYFRILFTLISAYIEIIVETIFSPYFLFVDILPGKSRFASWLRRFIANVIAFPLIFILLLIGATISQTFAAAGTGFLPPPLIGFTQTVMANIIGIGILISIPGIIERAKHAIHPQPMLVNFPQTPAAIVSTAATLLPFVPHYVSSVFGTPLGLIPGAKGKEGSTPKPPEIPHIPVPHGGG